MRFDFYSSRWSQQRLKNKNEEPDAPNEDE
jgi:hypothetical protein